VARGAPAHTELALHPEGRRPSLARCQSLHRQRVGDRTRDLLELRPRPRGLSVGGATDDFGGRPLSRAFRPFTGQILEGRLWFELMRSPRRQRRAAFARTGRPVSTDNRTDADGRYPPIDPFAGNAERYISGLESNAGIGPANLLFRVTNGRYWRIVLKNSNFRVDHDWRGRRGP
jgi:hypothetical protein